MTSTNSSANVSRFLAVLSVLLIAVGLSSSCNKDGSQNSRNNGVQQPGASPSPSPSPNASPAPSLQPAGETIIVIKGGSVDLDFNDTIYASNNASNPTYICNACTFKTLEVGPVGGPYTPCSIANQNSTITIHAGGGRKNIQIKRNSNSKIQIAFNATEYGPSGTKKHYNPNNNIESVKVTPSLSCQCPTGKKCEIHVITSY